METKRIIVTVEGGVIQGIQNIPAGVVVEVHDYDIDNGDEQDGTDADGNGFHCGIWESEGGAS